MNDESKDTKLQSMTALEAFRLFAETSIEQSNNKQEMLKKWLREKHKSNKIAFELFEYLSFSDQHFKTNSVKFLEVETGCDYYDLVKFLKLLDANGYGKFVAGRKGKDTRIDWNFHPKSVGRVAKNKSNRLELLPDKLPQYDGGTDDEGLVQHSFLLRPNLIIDITLPTDFNKKEADRLSRWLATIPFY